MLFNSYIFVLLFLPFVVSGYYFLHHFGWEKPALTFLITMSMIFYGYNSISYLLILIVSILLNYLIVKNMNSTQQAFLRRLLLIFGLLLNFGILFCFKYYDFFIENINTIFKSDYHFLRLALPLGISFYTFQQVSYVIDSYKNECESYGFLEYVAYVSFFPQLIAGPIVYHNELIPQLREKKNHKVNYENLSKGIYAFALGMAKKVLIADTLSKIVNVGYANVSELNSISTVIIMVCYSFQIYFDFSGYCDMAYGIGFLFNIELPVNFNSPYKAVSVRDFWDRWHMTLTRFFTKYVYIPLGGSRKGNVRTYVNVMIVFFVSGIWHGANWTFILWGIINGFGNLFDRLFEKALNKIPKMIRRTVTFCFCCIAWSLFRAESVEQGLQMLKNLWSIGSNEIYSTITDVFNNLLEVKIIGRLIGNSFIQTYPGLILFIFLAVLLFACMYMRNTQEKVSDGRYSGGRILTVAVLLIWSMLSLSEVSEFLYFNF